MLSPNSVWLRSIPIDAPIDPHSGQWVESVVQRIEKNVNFLYRNTAHAHFWATDQTPRQKVHLDVPQKSRPKLQKALESVPIPADFRPPGPYPEGDRTCCIYCLKDDKTVEYFEFNGMHQVEIDGPATAAEAPGTTATERAEAGWHCLAAAAVKDLSTSPGYVTNDDWPEGIDITESGVPNWGCSASRTISCYHAIKIAEAQRFYIPHALRLALPRDLHRPEPRYPALDSDGESKNFAHPPTGAIFTFDQADEFADVPDLFVRSVCRAIQRHGLILTDSSSLSGSTAVLKCETQATRYRSLTMGTDAWKGPTDEFGKPGAIFTDGDETKKYGETIKLGQQIPLARLRVLDESYEEGPETKLPPALGALVKGK